MCALCKERVREYAHRGGRALREGRRFPSGGSRSILRCVERRRRADKPGSVVDDHLSCLHVAVQFLARYPNAGRAGPWRSYSRLLRKGLAKPPCCHDAGGLLHHRFSFSLTRTSAGSGSLLFCGANPSGRPAWPLTSFLPCGARTFLTPAVSRRSRDRLARFARRYCTTRPALQSVAPAYPPFLVKQAIDTRPTLQSGALTYLAATAPVRPHVFLPPLRCTRISSRAQTPPRELCAERYVRVPG